VEEKERGFAGDFATVSRVQREYARIWIYVPTKVSEDTAFPFKIGMPCLVEIDEEKGQLVVKPISEKEATKLGWRKRIRRK